MARFGGFFYLTSETQSLGLGQNSMALPVSKTEVSGFSVQVSVFLSFFPDT